MISDLNKLLKIFLWSIQTVTVFARFLGISGFIPFSFAIFSTNICIGSIEIKWLTYGRLGIYMMKWYFLGISFISLLFFFASYSKAASILFLQSVITTMYAFLECIWSRAFIRRGKVSLSRINKNTTVYWGLSLATKAIGPCFISQAPIASAWI